MQERNYVLADGQGLHEWFLEPPATAPAVYFPVVEQPAIYHDYSTQADPLPSPPPPPPHVPDNDHFKPDDRDDRHDNNGAGVIGAN